MRTFFDEGTVLGHDTLTIHRTSKVIEMEFPGHQGSMFTYLLPKEDNSAWVVACWGNALDFLNDLEKKDRKSEVTAKWPEMARLLKNGTNKRFAAGALVQVSDPESGELRWGVMTEVKGVDVTQNAGNLWGFPQLLKAIEVVHKASATMYKELKENQPNNWPEAQKALMERCEGAEETLFFDFGFQ